MAVVTQDRAYGWATQSDYVTAKTPGANAFKKLIVTDNNFIDHQVATQNDDGFSHGYNTPTDQWTESHDNSVSHTMPGFIEELPKAFKLVLGGYAVTTPDGGTTAKSHKITPLSPAVSRQLQAVSYIEKVGAHDIMAPSMLGESLSLQGNDQGLLMCDLSLRGSGEVKDSGVTWGSHVDVLTGFHKVFNTQMKLELDNGSDAPYEIGCNYRAFNLSVQNEFLDAAGYKPGCNRYQTSGDNASGAIRSELLLNRQNITFNFTMDIGSTNEGFDELVKQTPMKIVLSAEGAEIASEGIDRALIVTMERVFYTARQIGESNGVVTFEISGTVMTDVSTGKSIEIEVVNDVATYATW